MRHFKLIPLYEELLGAMTAITRGLETGDSATTAVGWDWFLGTIASLEETIDDIESRQE